MGNNTHSERKAASIYTPALDIPGFCRNSFCHTTCIKKEASKQGR